MLLRADVSTRVLAKLTLAHVLAWTDTWLSLSFTLVWHKRLSCLLCFLIFIYSWNCRKYFCWYKRLEGVLLAYWSETAVDRRRFDMKLGQGDLKQGWLDCCAKYTYPDKPIMQWPYACRDWQGLTHEFYGALTVIRTDGENFISIAT